LIEETATEGVCFFEKIKKKVEIKLNFFHICQLLKYHSIQL